MPYDNKNNKETAETTVNGGQYTYFSGQEDLDLYIFYIVTVIRSPVSFFTYLS